MSPQVQMVDSSDVEMGSCTFEDASNALMALLHSPNSQLSWHQIDLDTVRSDENELMYLLFDLLDEAEGTQGLDDLGIFMHSKWYYHFRFKYSDKMRFRVHSPGQGYSAEVLGHPVYAHPRIRRGTIIVGGFRDDQSVMVVASPTEWTPDQAVIL